VRMRVNQSGRVLLRASIDMKVDSPSAFPRNVIEILSISGASRVIRATSSPATLLQVRVQWFSAPSPAEWRSWLPPPDSHEGIDFESSLPIRQLQALADHVVSSVHTLPFKLGVFSFLDIARVRGRRSRASIEHMTVSDQLQP
jgi:hypothetical protein